MATADSPLKPLTAEQALAEQRARGDNAGAARMLVNMAVVHYRRGDYQKALALYEKVLAEMRALRDIDGVGEASGP